MLKVLIPALFCTLIGFFAGYLLTRANFEAPHSATNSLKTPQPHPWPDAPPFALPRTTAEGQIPSYQYQDISGESTVFDQLLIAHHLANQASREELEEMALLALRSPDPLYHYNIVSVLLEKYTSVDPEGAIHFVESHNQFDQAQFIGHILTSWVRQDPEAAIDYFKNQQNLNLKRQLGARLLADPTLSATGLQSEVAEALGPYSEQLLSAVRLRQLEPASAFQQALSLTSSERSSQLSQALSRWMQTDPQSALQAVMQLTNYQDKEMLLYAGLQLYVQQDPSAAINFVRQFEPNNTNLEMQVINTLAQEDPARSLPYVEEFINRTGNSSILNGLLSNWIRKAPQDALAYMSNLSLTQRNLVLHNVANNYVQAYPREGIEWILGLDANSRQQVQAAIGNMVNLQTAPFVETVLPRITDPELRTRLIAGIANLKARQDPESAMDWLEQYRTDDAYLAARQNVLSTWARQDPRTAAGVLETDIQEPYAGALAAQLVANWYRADPDTALAWAKDLPASDARNQALAGLTAMIATSNVDEALAVLNQLPSGDYKAHARQSIAFSWASREPDKVETIIRSLGLEGTDAMRVRTLVKRRQSAFTN